MPLTPQHCPGFEQFKHLKSFVCNCPECGAQIEIFSDEFDRRHVCPKCRKEVNFKKSTIVETEEGATYAPR